MNIAIIGSGPAGLACANYLMNSKKEINVTIFDELEEFGGMVAYGIPEFIVPLANVKDQIKSAKEKGIKFVQKKIESVNELLSEFEYVVLAIGAGKGFMLNLPGEKNEKIVDALDFLKEAKLNNNQLLKKGEEVVVVGGGNASIDAALVAIKQGAKVTLIYRRTEKEMPAFENELEQAKKAKVIFNFLRTPIEYQEENGKIKVVCAIMELGEKDASGRASPVDTGERMELVFDKVLMSIGQKHDLGWIEKEGIELNGKCIMVENYQTSNEKVFACGDAIYGAKNIGTATLSGINCAKAMVENL